MPHEIDPVRDEFDTVRQQVLDAVRNKNADALLALDRQGFHGSKIPPGDPVFCFLFDSSCRDPKGRSVYDIVTNARRLAVVVRISEAWDTDGRLSVQQGRLVPRTAVLVLFDRAEVDERRLKLTDYFCQRWGRDVFTWTFKYVNGWGSASTIFDSATDAGCPVTFGRAGDRQSLTVPDSARRQVLQTILTRLCNGPSPLTMGTIDVAAIRDAY